MSKEAYSHYLLEVKQEYTKQLSNLLVPVMYEGLNSIYKEAKKNNRDSPMKMFQILLSRIPNWNQNIVIGEYNRIINQTQCDWINDLITAVFISHAKILSSITTKKKNKTLNLKIPNGDFFIHKAYIECARQFWKNPYLYYDDVNTIEYQRNMREVELIIEQSINETIRKLLPVKNILQQYITIDDESSSSSSSSSSSDSEKKEKNTKKKKINKNSEEEKAKYNEEYITNNITEKDKKKLEKSVKKEVSKAKKDLNDEEDDNFSKVSISHEIKPRQKTKKQSSKIDIPIIDHIIDPPKERAEEPILQSEAFAEEPILQSEAFAEEPILQSEAFAEEPILQSEAFAEERNILKNDANQKEPSIFQEERKSAQYLHNEPSKLQEELNLYKSLDMSNSHNIVLSDNDIILNNNKSIGSNDLQIDNDFLLETDDLKNYPPKIIDKLSEEKQNDYDFPMYNIDADNDNLSMNTKLDRTYIPLDDRFTKSSEKNIKISIEDIPKLIPNENIKTIEIGNNIQNGEINKKNVEEIHKEKKMTVQKTAGPNIKRDIKKNYSIF